MMASQALSRQEITFRPAEPADAAIAARLLFDSFPKQATFTFGLGDAGRAKLILERLFPMMGHRFSYEWTQAACFRGKLVGLFVGCPGRILGKLDRRLGRLMFRQYRLRGKLALLIRAFPLVFIKEAARDEFLLSNLAVAKQYRGRRIGHLLLDQVEQSAREMNLAKVSLMVAIQNRDARRLYEQYGYKICAIHLESNKRVRHVGAGYQRMVKGLGE